MESLRPFGLVRSIKHLCVMLTHLNINRWSKGAASISSLLIEADHPGSPFRKMHPMQTTFLTAPLDVQKHEEVLHLRITPPVSPQAKQRKGGGFSLGLTTLSSSAPICFKKAGISESKLSSTCSICCRLRGGRAGLAGSSCGLRSRALNELGSWP